MRPVRMYSRHENSSQKQQSVPIGCVTGTKMPLSMPEVVGESEAGIKSGDSVSKVVEK